MKDLESVKELIKSRVSLADLLKEAGALHGGLSEEQLSCVFHGADVKKSARYYRDTDSMYCWVCKKSWDIFSYVQQAEGISFVEAINLLLKRYRIDVSGLPDAVEKTVSKIYRKKENKVDQRKLAQNKLSQALTLVRDELPLEKYTKLVYSYMVLKNVIPDEKFRENFDLVRTGMVKVLDNAKKKNEVA